MGLAMVAGRAAGLEIYYRTFTAGMDSLTGAVTQANFSAAHLLKPDPASTVTSGPAMLYGGLNDTSYENWALAANQLQTGTILLLPYTMARGQPQAYVLEEWAEGLSDAVAILSYPLFGASTTAGMAVGVQEPIWQPSVWANLTDSITYTVGIVNSRPSNPMVGNTITTDVAAFRNLTDIPTFFTTQGSIKALWQLYKQQQQLQWQQLMDNSTRTNGMQAKLASVYIEFHSPNTYTATTIFQRLKSSDSNGGQIQPIVAVIAGVVGIIFVAGILVFAVYRERRNRLGQSVRDMSRHFRQLDREQRLMALPDEEEEEISRRDPPLTQNELEELFPPIRLTADDIPLIKGVYVSPQPAMRQVTSTLPTRVIVGEARALPPQSGRQAVRLPGAMTRTQSCPNRAPGLPRSPRRASRSLVDLRQASTGRIMSASALSHSALPQQPSTAMPLTQLPSLGSDNRCQTLRYPAIPGPLRYDASSIADGNSVSHSSADEVFYTPQSLIPTNDHKSIRSTTGGLKANETHDQTAIDAAKRLLWTTLAPIPEHAHNQYAASLSPPDSLEIACRPSLEKSHWASAALSTNLSNRAYLSLQNPTKSGQQRLKTWKSLRSFKSVRSLRSIRTVAYFPFLSGWVLLKDDEADAEDSTGQLPPVNPDQPSITALPRFPLDTTDAVAITIHEEPPPPITPTAAVAIRSRIIRRSTAGGTMRSSKSANTDQPICVICLDTFEAGQCIRRLGCYHIFHVDCIDAWVTGVASTCPLCKQSCRSDCRSSLSTERFTSAVLSDNSLSLAPHSILTEWL
ncbi:hypothetical protein H4R34_004645 [Dimargaris verticillata]|uniref:RING-type domain-containing protein n=1 Tax=Dimargaris verticillata TaxID=2761393 RepID=A0A9W8EAZ0_9FUNG|nr:hypothetical protein H4R34_004645 [Dimargaris verticillata]